MTVKVFSNYGKKETFLTVDKNGYATKRAYDNAVKRVGLADGDYLRLSRAYYTSNNRVSIHVVIRHNGENISIFE